MWMMAIVGLFSGGCAKDSEAPLCVGTNVWPGFECLYLARDLGYFNGAAIKLVEYPSTSEVLRAYRNGAIEVAAVTMDEAFSLAEQAWNPRVALITDVSAGADVILAQPEIKDLHGLKGQRVGVESTALGAYVITRALQQAGMSLADIRVVSVEASEHEQAFLKGQVDAVVTFEPTRSNLLARGARLLFNSRQIPDEIVDVLVVRDSVMEGDHHALQPLVDGWFRAQAYLKDNPQDAARRMCGREGVSPEQFLKSLEGLRFPTLQENRDLLGANGVSFRKTLQQVRDVMVSNGLLKPDVDPSAMLDARLVLRTDG